MTLSFNQFAISIVFILSLLSSAVSANEDYKFDQLFEALGGKTDRLENLVKLLDRLPEIETALARLDDVETELKRLRIVEKQYESLIRNREDIMAGRFSDIKGNVADNDLEDDVEDKIIENFHYKMKGIESPKELHLAEIFGSQNTIGGAEGGDRENVGKLKRSQTEGMEHYRQVPGFAAFTAYVSVPDLTLRDQETVKFDYALFNHGSAYNNNTGLFTAPVSGYYIVSVTATTNPGKHQYFGIVVNDSVVPGDFFSQSGPSNYNSVTRVWTFVLGAGSEVSVRALGAGGVHGNKHTSFSAWLLSPL